MESDLLVVALLAQHQMVPQQHLEKEKLDDQEEVETRLEFFLNKKILKYIYNCVLT